jgi:hypothetical protein
VIKYPVDQTDVIARLFLYYFIGLVISRIGSLTIAPVLKETGFVKFAPYGDYIKASRNDPKIEVLSEANNTYRTLAALFLVLLAVKIYARVTTLPLRTPHGWAAPILMALLMIMFLFAYRKQVGFIRERVEHNL